MFGVRRARECLLEFMKPGQFDLHQGRAESAQTVEVLEQFYLHLAGIDVLGDGDDCFAVGSVGRLIGRHVLAPPQICGVEHGVEA